VTLRITGKNSELLADVLRSAKTHVPYYKKIITNDHVFFREKFDTVPLLEKKDIIQHQNELLDERVNIRDLIKDTTSGSTGTPLTIYRSYTDSFRSGKEIWARRRQYADIGAQDRYAKYYRFLDHDFSYKDIIQEKNFIALSLMNLTDEGFRDFCTKILEFKPRWFFAVPSATYLFARFLQNSEYGSGEFLGFKYIELSGEYVFDYQLELIKNVFKCPVVNHYGSRETWAIATTCENGRFHVVDTNVHLEIVDARNRPIPESDIGVRGEVVVTALHNMAMPFIRYRLGDIASWEVCDCGWDTPVIKLHGARTTEFIITPSGPVSSVVFYLLAEKLNARYDKIMIGFQVVQTKMDEFVFKVIPAKNFDERIVKEEIERDLAGYLSYPVTVRLETGGNVEALPGGKWKYFISEVKDVQVHDGLVG